MQTGLLLALYNILSFPVKRNISSLLEMLMLLLSYELNMPFVNKNVPEFCKVWNAKFHKNVSKQVIAKGSTYDEDIGNEFAHHLLACMLITRMIMMHMFISVGNA
jgi:hypothetical protein